MTTVLDPLVIGLLLAAAFMHASWNAILKADSSDRLASFAVIMLTGALLCVPLLFLLPLPAAGAWKWLAISVLIHQAYYFCLLKAYSLGDLSHTYPIARGLGPLLVALLSGRLVGEALRLQDGLGAALLFAGIVALATPQRRAVDAMPAPVAGAHFGWATVFAILTGITIAGYIFADGLGVRAAGPGLEHKIGYIAWLNVCEGPWLMVVLLYARRRGGVFARRSVLRAVGGGAIATLGYGIAIWALAVGPMAHVAAVRETSVLFGALMGAILLREPFGARRIAAAAVIVCGLVLMNGPNFA
jgi:drug/metabolite transporter (DMT)-like permease